MTTENKPRAPRETVSSGRKGAQELARVDRLQAIDARTDVEWNLQADILQAEAEALTAPAAPTVRAYDGASDGTWGQFIMADLSIGTPSHGWSLTQAAARNATGVNYFAARAVPWQLPRQARATLLASILRRAVAWRRAEAGSVSSAAIVGPAAIGRALDYGRRAELTLASVRAHGVSGDRGPVNAILSAMAEWERCKDGPIQIERLLGAADARADLDADCPGWRTR